MNSEDIKDKMTQITLSVSVKFSDEEAAEEFYEDMNLEQDVNGYRAVKDGNQVNLKLATTEGKDPADDLDNLFNLVESAFAREDKGNFLG